jgi:hypothetical protein
MDKSAPDNEPTDSSQANDDERFDAFIALLNSSPASNEGNEEMAVMVYCEASPLPEPLTKH